ncbi:MAG: TonB-dependent receptor domain-containing protein [Weeksellaceae bacterium]
MNKVLIMLFTVFGFSLMAAQNGTVRGEAFDSMTVDPLQGLTVKTADGSQQTSTDLEGAFNLELAPGVYTIIIAGDNYYEQKIEDVEVTANEVNYIGELFLDESLLTTDQSVELEGIVVTAAQSNNTETALLKMKKKSVIMLDGISAAKMELAGDGNAVDAAKRVTGVSVEGGKYVYIRGLGDRYSKTTLNGFEIPGLDPDKNTIQMDIFPTSLMDNVMVSKNFTADQPADFTGGIMNIKTKDFPKNKFMSISAGIGYNPDMHFNSDYITYEGGGTDFLGFDDGTRELPSNALTDKLPYLGSNSAQEVATFMNQFNSTLAPENKSSLLDFDMSFSMGDQISLKNSTNENRRQLGYVLSLSYKNKTKFYDDDYYGQYVRDIDVNNTEMLLEKEQKGSLGVNSVLAGILGGVAYKTNNSKYVLNLMHLQNGEKSSSVLDIVAESPSGVTSQFKGFAYTLGYNEKSLSNLSLHGTHAFPESDWELEWGISPTLSKASDPDLRRTAYETTTGKIKFNAGGAGMPTRYWRELNEYNVASKIDLVKDLSLFNEDAKLKLGASNTYKNRDYSILSYNVQFYGPQFDWIGDGNEVFSPDYLNTGQVYFSTSFIDDKINPNEYESNSNNIAGYASLEFNPIANLKAILGVRAENYVLKHTGRPIDVKRPEQRLDNDEVLNSLDFFPSVNLIYEATSRMNMRGSFTKTIARPSFKEMSYAQILDPISQVTFNGGLFELGDWKGNLVETRVNNFDLRWEYYMNNSEMFSLSGFYKTFDDPIELVLIASSASINVQPRNVGDGKVIGGEFEFRKNFDFVSADLENLSLNANVTVVKSTIEMTEMEYQDRKAYEKNGENIERERDMAGQAPYIINAGFTYTTPDNDMEYGLFYNVKGSTLNFVGNGLRPDIYSNPFHKLNFSLVKKFGDSVVDLKIDNILGDNEEDVYRSFDAADQVFQSRSLGRTISIGYKYSF